MRVNYALDCYKNMSLCAFIFIPVLGPCKSTACFNGGQCVADLKTKVAVCVCPSGFSGPACQQGITNKQKFANVKCKTWDKYEYCK